MAILAVPPVLNGAGDLVPARLFVRLMLANGTSAIGFVGTDLVTEFQNLPIPLEGLEVTLNPQALIAMESGVATYYEMRVQTAHRTEQFVVQLADSVTPQELETLVGAAAIDPADITVGRLIPSGGTDGQVLTKSANTDYAVEWVTGGAAASVSVAFTPTNYAPASPDVEAHLAAINAVLGGLL